MSPIKKTACLRLCIALAAICSPAESFAQINVIISGGFSAAFQQMLPDFEKSTGITVTTTRGASQGSGPNTIGAQLRRGVPADVVIMSKEGLEALIAEGKIAAGTAADLAQTPLGLAVRAGASKPDISTVDAFKRALLAAKSITFPASTTGIYMTTKLFPQLGIARELVGKITNTGVAAVADGAAEIAIQPVSELLHAPGADFAGVIPKEIQYISVFSTAQVAGSKQARASARLIAFLKSGSAAKAIRNSGMDPLASR